MVALPICSILTDGLLGDGGCGTIEGSSIRTNGLFRGGPIKPDCSSFRTTGGGAAKTGTACLIRTGGAICTAGAIICAGRLGGGCRGGVEYTGTGDLIVTGGAIPWYGAR